MSSPDYEVGASRALLTETDRELLAEGDGEREQQVASRVKRRIGEELTTDIELLSEHRPEVFRRLRSVVLCDDAIVGDGIPAYKAVLEHPETGQREFVFCEPGHEPEVIDRVAYDNESSNKISWGYRGTGGVNSARSILEHAFGELDIDAEPTRKQLTSFAGAFVGSQSPSEGGWAIPLASVELWVRENIE